MYNVVQQMFELPVPFAGSDYPSAKQVNGVYLASSLPASPGGVVAAHTTHCGWQKEKKWLGNHFFQITKQINSFIQHNTFFSSRRVSRGTTYFLTNFSQSSNSPRSKTFFFWFTRNFKQNREDTNSNSRVRKKGGDKSWSWVIQIFKVLEVQTIHEVTFLRPDI
jgi:hypothetical protein